MKPDIKNKVFITICKETIIRKFNNGFSIREYIKDKKYYSWYEDSFNIWVVSVEKKDVKSTDDLTQLSGSRFYPVFFKNNFLFPNEIRKEKLKNLKKC